MTIPSNDEIREAMMKVPARIAAKIAVSREEYDFTYNLLMKEVTEACSVLEKPPNPKDP